MSTQIQRPSEDATQAGVFPVVEPGHTFATITEKISAIVVRRGTPLWWLAGFLMAFGIMNVMLMAIGWLFYKGTGIWGVNAPVGWGFAIINFVWWIGIGHAGTLISAILLLLRQGWRTSINRFAEAMTLFAVACAGIFPLIHMGRPWLAYWLTPYPNTVVSFDFTIGIIPGWHATIFPPYFVAGAIYAGFAMVLLIAIPLRAVYGLQDFITLLHLRNMAKVLLATSMIVCYGYLMEAFF